MNVSLYEISADFLKALDGLEVDEETGEIMNFDAVEALDAQFEDKAESVACYIKNLSAFAADLKAEEENLSTRRKTVERRVDSVKKYLSSCLATVGKDKVETAKARISFRKSIQVQIDDEAALPANYVTTTVTTKPDKTAIKKAIQAGEDVGGIMADKKTTTQAAEQAALDPPAAVRNDIPLLTEKDIECRVQSVSRAKTGRVGAVLLLYKDARVDMRILDQVFGPGNWQRTHEVINGNLFCNIDIWDAEKRAWVRKQDVGVESNTEKEKGQASDAFKRAGFNVGIGRELYTGPFIYVELADNEFYSEGQNGRKEVLKCYSNTRFTVAHVAYNDRREICELVIADRNGNVRFDMNKRVQGPPQTAQGGQGTTTQGNAQGQGKQAPRGRQGAPAGTPAPQTENGAVCPICGKPITKAEQDYSVRKYGREACRTCQKAL